MKDRFKINTLALGLIFTIASAVFTVLLSDTFFFDGTRLQPFLFDAGVDALGTLVCAALFYGSMKQEGEGSKTFRTLVVMVSACFMANAAMYFVTGAPEHNTWNFIFTMISKLLDLAMIYFFYQYVKATMEFKGKLARWTDKGVPVLLAVETLVILSNIFYPVTFSISSEGTYQYTGASWAEDIFLIVVSLITTVLIIKSESARSQKVAALTFLLFPVLMYFFLGGTFGNAAQYGAVLMSLIIVYCIIFNYNTGKLAATQTELDMATEIQAGMLPSIFPAFPNREEFDLYAFTVYTFMNLFWNSFDIESNRITKRFRFWIQRNVAEDYWNDDSSEFGFTGLSRIEEFFTALNWYFKLYDLKMLQTIDYRIRENNAALDRRDFWNADVKYHSFKGMKDDLRYGINWMTQKRNTEHTFIYDDVLNILRHLNSKLSHI